MAESCGKCGAPATTSWQRYLADAELWLARVDPNVPSVGPRDTEALKPVFACEGCKFPDVVDAEGIARPSDLSAIVHAPDCRAPGEYEGPCCSVAEAIAA